MAAKANPGGNQSDRPPYFKIFCKAFPQLLNIFMVFFVTLSIFPNVHSGQYFQKNITF